VTALSCINQFDRISLVADGAYFEAEPGRTGIIGDIGSKLTIHPTARAAWGHRGGGGHADHIMGVLFQSATFDEIVEAVANAVWAAYELERVVNRSAPEGYHECDLTLAGWSESRGQVEAWKVSARGNNLTPAMTLQSVPWLSYAPDPTGGDPARNIFDIFPVRPDRITKDQWTATPTHELAGALIDAQRAYSLTDEHHTGDHVAGAFAEFVTIRETGVERHMLRRWPNDTIGHPVDLEGPVERFISGEAHG
jgi:hypothetical protein